MNVYEVKTIYKQSQIKTKSIPLFMYIQKRNSEKLIAEGSTVLACLDENRRPRTIPDKIKKAVSHN
jgi:acyl-CoA thioesterase FadM